MQEAINSWSETAPYWEKHRATIREMFAPITQALIDHAGITSGSNVLDVGTGPGEPALAIAELVGSGGKVLGIDPVPEMVAAARREAQRRELHNASFAVSQADVLPAQAGSFDAVVSRFAVMFFPDPVGGVREMLRVLKPRRKMALAVWHFAERNPFHYILSRVVDRYADSPPVAADAPDPFRFAERGKLRAVLLEAGATEVSETLLRFPIRARGSMEEFWTLRSEMSDKLRSKLAKMPRERMGEVKREVMEALREYSEADGVNLPAEVLIVAGTKPA